jgi:hypothetical protein
MRPACQKLFQGLKNKKRLAITFGDITGNKKPGHARFLLTAIWINTAF